VMTLRNALHSGSAYFEKLKYEYSRAYFLVHYSTLFFQGIKVVFILSKVYAMELSA